jgi:transposase
MGNEADMGRNTGRRGSAVTLLSVEDVEIYLCREPVDFRLGINGLSTMVEATLKFDPFSRNLFCFINKRKNQIKVLYWQRSGFCLWLKRLEEEKFEWPTYLTPLASSVARPPVVVLSDEQFYWLLDGLDLKHLKPHRALEYRSVL